MPRPFSLPGEQRLFELADQIYIDPDTLAVHASSKFDYGKAYKDLHDQGELTEEGIRLELAVLEGEHVERQQAKAYAARIDTAQLVNNELHQYTDGRPPLWESLSRQFGGQQYTLNHEFINELYEFVHDHCAKMPYEDAIEKHASNAIPRLMLKLFELIFAGDGRRISDLSGMWRRRNYIPVDRTSGAVLYVKPDATPEN